jgi:hypothetical protein
METHAHDHLGPITTGRGEMFRFMLRIMRSAVTRINASIVPPLLNADGVTAEFNLHWLFQFSFRC